MANRLAGATSPYLLQHKDNPVEWHPWGEEAIEAARSQDRPIFLSIGYSACHWCHVMEKESFEDAATAGVMNELFINIKVDREERPDLDDIYMTAVQMLTGSGGWPMSVWLTPDLKPFYAGTYFPKQGMYGRPSFVQVLEALGRAWKTDRTNVLGQAGKIHDSLVDFMSGGRIPRPEGEPTSRLIAGAVGQLAERFDRTHGGFGPPPKFPPSRGLALLLQRYRETKAQDLLDMVTFTLDRMAAGGMYDQFGGGFHRYSTDAQWLVPHFEKMLYDNALLAEVYAVAWQTTGKAAYRAIVEEIFDWLAREMTSPEGAFFSTLDADSEGEEGKFYVWTPSQVVAILGEKEASTINRLFDITPGGNFEGACIPHTGALQEDRNDDARRRLREARGNRVWPHLDDKILSAWNGMMISALARASRIFEEPVHAKAAARAADFLLERMKGDDGLLRVSYREGRLSPDAFLDDQAFVIKGLIDLHETTADRRWLDEALVLLKATDRAFRDPSGKGYFFTRPGQSDLLVRAKNPTDGAIPSGNSVMANAMVALHRLTGEPAWLIRAGEILEAFSGAMSSMPGAFHNMLTGLAQYLQQGGEDLPSGADDIVTVSPPASVDLEPGKTTRFEICLEIKPGWHVNASPATFDYLIPTTLVFDLDPRAAVAELEYPAGKKFAAGFAGQPLEVYEGMVRVAVGIEVPEGAPSGLLQARGILRYQACDEQACMKPAEKTFTFPARILESAPGAP